MRKHPSEIAARWAIILIFNSVAAFDQQHTVWQIGNFDQSPVEFSSGRIENVHFDVGSSTPEKDWPRSQRTGQSYRISFPLNRIHGSYKLTIAALIDRPRVPALKIDINQHAGIFYLHPQLSYARSDFSYAFDPHESQSTVTLDIPPAFLISGANSITITCIDDPPTPAGAEEIGGISYDALRLEQDEAARAESVKPLVDLIPTIFYRNTPGGLAEIVDAFI